MKRIGLLALAALLCAAPTAGDQAASDFDLSDLALRKGYGPVKGAYYDPVFRGGVLVLEDATGTVRLVGVNPGSEPRLLQVLLRKGN